MDAFRIHRKPKILTFANHLLAPRYLKLRCRNPNKPHKLTHKCVLVDILKYAKTMRDCTEIVKKSMKQAVKRMGELDTDRPFTMSIAATKARVVLVCARNIKAQMRLMRRLCKVGPPQVANPHRVLPPGNLARVQQLERGLALAATNMARIVKGWDTLVADANVFSKITKRRRGKK